MPEVLSTQFKGLIADRSGVNQDSERTIEGRKTISQLFLSGLHWDYKTEKFARRNEKRGVKKTRFPSANFSRKAKETVKGVKLKKK